jgi:hypothetical protein
MCNRVCLFKEPACRGIDRLGLRWISGRAHAETCPEAIPSERLATIVLMWQVLVACSGCEEETEVVVEELRDVDREVCPCGYSYVVLTVSDFEPVYAERGQLIALPRRRKLSTAA